jgi:hypothetical protein
MKKMFTGSEAALAYALAAERVCGKSEDFLNANPPVIPIFVSLLCQSVEISIKQAGIKSGLFTMDDARAKQQRKGHGLNEIALLANERLGSDSLSFSNPLVMAITYSNQLQNSETIIKEMLFGNKFKKTREMYASRNLGYADVSEGDFAIIDPVKDWIGAVKETANNLPETINILTQWKNSSSKSKHFAIWIMERNNKK